MKNKLVISNSSPLMNLAVIQQLNLVRELFVKITVPEQVWRELTVDGKGKAGADEIMRSDWIEIANVKNIELIKLLNKDLDIGESAAIALAVERKADLILLDETDARNMADIYHLSKTGVLGILMRAKKYKIISEVKPLLEKLRKHAKFRIAQFLYDEILIQTGELQTD